MKIGKSAFQCIVVFAFVLCICMSCLYLSCLIPSNMLKNNIEESIEELENLGSKKTITIMNRKIMFDIYADAMMLNTAYSIDSNHPFYSMLFARSNYVDGITDHTYQDKAYELNKVPVFPDVEDLGRVVRGEKLYAIEYARYWHGYLMILRPLLVLFNYMEIKTVNYIIHFILIAILLYQIKKKIGLKYWIAVVFGLIAVEGYLVCSCLEETIGISLILVESIILLSKKIKNYGMYFLVIGMLTAFFDLLTIPVATFFVPLVLYILMNQKQDNRLLWKTCIKYFILCLLGYVAMWAMKWILVDLIYKRELVKNAIRSSRI
ncbi:MAG: hypothetical protein Q4D02_08535 [Clostridia bacterium]|nr:hypothetical protein [Clostridia bacterium]